MSQWLCTQRCELFWSSSWASYGMRYELAMFPTSVLSFYIIKDGKLKFLIFCSHLHLHLACSTEVDNEIVIIFPRRAFLSSYKKTCWRQIFNSFFLFGRWPLALELQPSCSQKATYMRTKDNRTTTAALNPTS